MSNVMLGDMISAKELRTIIRLKSTKECFQDKRLQWFDESAWSSKWRTFKVSDSLPREKPRKTWKEVTRRDLKEKKFSKVLTKNKIAWKCFISNFPTRANIEKRC